MKVFRRRLHHSGQSDRQRDDEKDFMRRDAD